MATIEIIFRDSDDEKKSPNHYLLEMGTQAITGDTRGWIKIGNRYFTVVDVLGTEDTK